MTIKHCNSINCSVLFALFCYLYALFPTMKIILADDDSTHATIDH